MFLQLLDVRTSDIWGLIFCSKIEKGEIRGNKRGNKTQKYAYYGHYEHLPDTLQTHYFSHFAHDF